MKRPGWLGAALRVGAAGTVIAALLGAMTSAAPLSAAAPAGGPMRWYLEIPGFGGASAGSTPATIQIDSWSWGMSNPLTVGSSGSGSGAGKVQANPLTIRRTVDQASPVFLQDLVTGRHFATVKLVGEQVGPAGKAVPLITFTFSDVMIASDQLGGSNGRSASESLSLVFTKVEFQFAGQGATTTSGSLPIVSWNLVTNSAA